MNRKINTLSEKTKKEIDRYVAERDNAVKEAVYNDNLVPLKRMIKNYSALTVIYPMPNDETIRVMARKMMCEITNFTAEERKAVADWLHEHGSKTMFE